MASHVADIRERALGERCSSRLMLQRLMLQRRGGIEEPLTAEADGRCGGGRGVMIVGVGLTISGGRGKRRRQ